MGEAMSSGMVVVTNDVAAIPEFIDDSCGVLVPADDPVTFCNAIINLVKNSNVVPTLSNEAGRRVRSQCGFPNTIQKEIDLFKK
jgi:glycosyltransferase involved in cell wall biosynthesis